MFSTLVLCNINLLPSNHVAYSMVLKWLVPLAVPLLLLDADLRKCFKSMSSLFKAFLVGSFGSFVGSIIAFKLGLMFYTHLFDMIRFKSIMTHFSIP